MNNNNSSYKRAGVDVTAGYKAVELIKAHAQSTYIPGVLSNIGGFGGLFEIGTSYSRPVLVSGTDGVGTKLKLAFEMDKHDTIGIDCVAMCANDVACSGAKPLFFLDYIATGKNIPEKIEQIIVGVSEGCRQAGCALIGGETAEMPGFYSSNEYDIAGFCVGIADYDDIINGSSLSVGDVLIGLESSGVHSNGFSLIRKIFKIDSKTLNLKIDDLGKTLGEELLTPTKIYVNPIQKLLPQLNIHAISHITGGGFYENIPRMLRAGQKALIEKGSIPVKPIFKVIQNNGGIEEKDMYNIFNMGIGLCIAVGKEDVQKALDILAESGEKAVVMGEIVPSSGEAEVELC